jgi:bacillopeptidase F
MRLKTRIKVVPAVLTALLGSHAAAGTLDPALADAIAGMAPGDVVDVIIRCVNPLDPESVTAEKLVPALKQKASACERSLSKALKGTAADTPENLWIINGIAARVPVAALNGLVHRAGVDVVYLNEKVYLPPAPVPASVPSSSSYKYWNIEETRVPDLWALGHYGSGVVVATMDTGVDRLHASIGPQWRGGTNSWFDPHGQYSTPFDSNGHGTQVMSLIVGGEAGGVQLGMAPDARWIAVKLFNSAGQSDLAKIHQGFQWLLDPNGNGLPEDAPQIVNSSWVLQGTEGRCLGEFATDIAALRAADISVVFSAGNSGVPAPPATNTSMEPANDPGSLAVGAVNDLLSVSGFSSRGPSACDGDIYPRLAAPGEGVLTAGLTLGGAYPTNFDFGTGTSFAAPHVAGAIAVLKSALPNKRLAEIEAAVEGGATDLGALGVDNDSGAGVLDTVAAYLLLGDATPPPPPPPPPADTDGDGVPDTSDLCPGTPVGQTVDANGCSASQRDSDGDGVRDALDQCPATPTGQPVDASGCSASQRDSDGDGVSDAVDQCPSTPAGEPADASGCSASQRDSDGDGVNDALDDCPNTAPGTPVDALGCPVVTGPVDGDGDGHTSDLDCNDASASVYPGAPEVKHDGIDQDCNGYDLTIEATSASYNTRKRTLSVTATSALGSSAKLVVEGYGPMKWDSKNKRWTYSGSSATKPATVTVSGVEGSTAVAVK